MSGHSKWSQIKRQKGVADARRGQLFTKLGREITVAAREGGADPANLDAVRAALEQEQLNVTSAETAMVPKATVEADPKEAVAVLKLMERLEELDDVQHVYTNVEFNDEVLSQFAGR